MITLTLQLPDPVATPFFDAAEKLNDRFAVANPKIDAHALMAFVLARHDCDDVCAQFDLALRLVRGPAEPPFNPVLKS